MKKFVISLSIAIGLVVAPIQSAEAAKVPTKKCASMWVANHPYSKTAKKCKKQGWLYEKGTYLQQTETTPMVFAPYVLVIGPAGHIWVDTAGFYTNPR